MRSYIRVWRARTTSGNPGDPAVHYGATPEEAATTGYADPIRIWFFMPHKANLIDALNRFDTAFIEFVFENEWGLTDTDPWPNFPN
jgi:hypothetical protein